MRAFVCGGGPLYRIQMLLAKVATSTMAAMVLELPFGAFQVRKCGVENRMKNRVALRIELLFIPWLGKFRYTVSVFLPSTVFPGNVPNKRIQRIY